jgi:hypothetical protein
MGAGDPSKSNFEKDLSLNTATPLRQRMIDDMKVAPFLGRDPEAAHLKLGDIDSQRMVIRVDQGNGQKYRNGRNSE